MLRVDADASRLLAAERETLGRFIPGLADALRATPLAVIEAPGNDALRHFRACGGPGAGVPRRYKGKGATALDLVRVQRAVGALSPSLAIATTMHHFSVATLVELGAVEQGMEWLILQAVAENALLVASGFAEGRTGQHVLRPTLLGRRTEHGLVVSGAKKPCSLAYSMDVLSANVALDDGSVAVVLVPAKSPGIERRHFWNTWVLAGAESDEVVLNDVVVPHSMVFIPARTMTATDPVHLYGFAWFELLVTASYLGVASALMERVIASGRAPADAELQGVAEVQGAMAALERVATLLDEREASDPEAIFAGAMYARLFVQGAIERVSAVASRLAGGIAFMASSDLAYLYAACRALAYHPPAIADASGPLASYLRGGPLVLD